MKFPARGVVWLLPLLLTGCFHKTHPAQVPSLAPPIVNIPPPRPTPVPVPAQLSPQVLTTPEQAPRPVAKVEPKPAPRTPAKRIRRRPGNSQQAASNEISAVSAIGELSLGDPSSRRQPTMDLIASVERGLDGIHRKLGAPEQKTAAQIREFLKQAREALASGDVYGAHTLALKAKVLLGELSR
ncbi:MAG: hypothetical protein ACP5FH_09695 [Terracidiphilus sp.]